MNAEEDLASEVDWAAEVDLAVEVDWAVEVICPVTAQVYLLDYAYFGLGTKRRTLS